MDQSRVGVAMALLAKAQSTDAQPEAAALIERSYRILAEVINAYDLECAGAGGPRRRERRFLRDRRADRRGAAAQAHPSAQGQPSTEGQPSTGHPSDRAQPSDRAHPSTGPVPRVSATDSGARYRQVTEAPVNGASAVRLTL